MANEPADLGRRVARHVSQVLGGKPTVHRYRSDDTPSYVDVLRTSDPSASGTASYSTVNLSRTSLIDVGQRPGLRVEFVGVANANEEDFGNILAAAALRVIDHRVACAPGCVYENVIAKKPKRRVRHVLLLPVFAWETLTPLVVDELEVAWLQIVPLTDGEARFAREQGVDRLEKAFEAADVDYALLTRPSVV